LSIGIPNIYDCSLAARRVNVAYLATTAIEGVFSEPRREREKKEKRKSFFFKFFFQPSFPRPPAHLHLVKLKNCWKHRGIAGG
jgi:hypothetical protein